MKHLYRFFQLTFLILLLSQNIFAQTGQVWQCNTDETENLLLKNSLDEISLLSTPVDTTAKVVNVFVHVIRRSDGTGGLSNAQVNNWINLLCSDYIAHNIIIQVIGQSDINNTTYYNGITNNTYSTLISTNTHNNAIDIYLLSPDDSYSRASGIPGIALTVGGIYVETSVLSHEFGHCLGLYHTHSGRGCGDDANCIENTNGSNCSTCGDLVCDTPADPCLSGNVDSSCTYIGNPSFSPDIHNIMSYTPPTCLNRITPGQTVRMHSKIRTSSIFNNRVSYPTITGPESFCSSATFTLNNVPTGATVTWQVTPTQIINTTTNGNTVTVTPTGSTWSSIFITATINTACGSTSSIIEYESFLGVPRPKAYDDFGQEIFSINACTNLHHNITFNVPSGATEWQWTKVSGNFTLQGSSNSGTIIGFQSTFGIIEVRYKSSLCNDAWSVPALIMVNISDNCSGGGLFSVYPNPASSELIIQLSDSLFGSTLDETYQVILINQKSLETVYSTMLIEKKFKILLDKFPEGIYYLSIYYKEAVLQKQIIIKR